MLPGNSGENGSNFHFGISTPSWMFTKEEVKKKTPSRMDGISYTDEMDIRRDAGRFVLNIVINMPKTDKNEQITGLAAVIIHRFFQFHSCRRFDYQDVAAACCLLVSKIENVNWSMHSILRVWWALKFPKNPVYQTAHHDDSRGLIKYLEEILLQTIGFDLNIVLPHQHILTFCDKIEETDEHKSLRTVAYNMVSPTLMITNWSLCYPPTLIAAVCLNISAQFNNVDMNTIFESETWFQLEDDSVKLSDITELTREFMQIYQKPWNRLGYIHYMQKIKSEKQCKNVDSTQNASSHQTAGTLESNSAQKSAGDKHKLGTDENVSSRTRSKSLKLSSTLNKSGQK